MTQYQAQRRFGLLRRHFSQQETIPVLPITPSNILLDNVIPQTHTGYTSSGIPGLAQHPAISNSLDPMTYQAIPTTPYPLLDREMLTTSYPMVDQDIEPDQEMPIVTQPKKFRVWYVIAAIIILALPLALYLIWRPASSVSPSPIIVSQSFSETATEVSSNKSGTMVSTTDNSTGDLQAYIVGAVEHPGVYRLPANARVYQLLQAAGGPSPNADLVALNLAAKLNDGQEIYVTAVGERLPAINSSLSGTSSGSSSTGSSSNQPLVNVNTANADEMEQQLHVSSKTAQTIIDYRQQHGPFTSVSQLSQVVSKSIYDKIKNQVTV